MSKLISQKLISLKKSNQVKANYVIISSIFIILFFVSKVFNIFAHVWTTTQFIAVMLQCSFYMNCFRTYNLVSYNCNRSFWLDYLGQYHLHKLLAQVSHCTHKNQSFSYQFLDLTMCEKHEIFSRYETFLHLRWWKSSRVYLFLCCKINIMCTL